MKKIKTTRVQLQLPPDVMDRLVRLKSKTEAVSYSEVVRKSIKVHEQLLDISAIGELLVRRSDGSTHEVLILIL